MVFGRNFCEKRQIWVFETHFGNVRVTHDFGSWRVRKPMVNLIELFSLSITVPWLWGEICTDLLFSPGVNLLAFKFYLHRVVPINHSWHQKARDIGSSPILGDKNIKFWGSSAPLRGRKGIWRVP